MNDQCCYGRFNGHDYTCFIDGKEVPGLMAHSYTIHTEKIAVYENEQGDPVRFDTGRRGIAGTLVFNYSQERPFEGSGPFDVEIGIESSGTKSLVFLDGVELVNEGGGHNIDDLITQVAYTYVAKDVRFVGAQ